MAIEHVSSLAVINVHFKFNGIWSVLSNGRTMHVPVGLKLDKVWIKSFETSTKLQG